MDNDSKEQSTGEVYELGKWMGRKQAFSLVAGATAAADVECLRQIRERKLYAAKGLDWAEFCKQHAGITRSYADRLIRHLEDFGPNYFNLSQIVRISPDVYRKIAPAVSDEGIALGGEKIAICPENSDQLVEAVNELRAAIPAKEAAAGVAAARRRLELSVAALHQVVKGGLSDEERQELAQTVSAGLTGLNQIWVALR